MIGTKKLAAIKKELREKLRKDKKRVQQWVDRKQARLSAGDSENRRVLEELMWIRKLLREIVEEDETRPKRSRKTKPQKEPAAGT
jgi:hypothetical protein